MKWFVLLFYNITGGRPMMRERFLFTDSVVHREVYVWVDYFDRRWMAFARWDKFRVPFKPIKEEK